MLLLSACQNLFIVIATRVIYSLKHV